MKNKIICLLILGVFILNISAQTSETKNFQIGIVSPLGTNGTQSHLITNKISVNILGGHSYGNTAFEWSGLYAINLHLTQGFQLAGITNFSAKSENACQIAGITNIVADGTSPFQLSGIANRTNIANGVQISGITNIAKEVTGLQLSGIVNVTKKLSGIQLGLINYADESDGLSLGLINIIRKNGKHELEIGFSEAINTSLSYKLGTNKFYTIFSAGINYIDQPVEYAAGIGFGNQIDMKKGWTSQIELMGYSLSENKSFDTKSVNMLTQLKFSVSKELAPHFKVFAGPTLNMTISDYINPTTNELGSSLSPWSMWKNNSDKTRLNAWIGFNAGVRF